MGIGELVPRFSAKKQGTFLGPRFPPPRSASLGRDIPLELSQPFVAKAGELHLIPSPFQYVRLYRTCQGLGSELTLCGTTRLQPTGIRQKDPPRQEAPCASVQKLRAP